MAVKELIIEIKAKTTNILAGLKEIGSASEKLEAQLAGAAKVSGAAFAALSAVVGIAAYRFAEFEKSFSSVIASLDEGSFKTKTLEQGIEGLKEGIIDLALKSGDKIQDLNKGMFDLISSGIDAEKAMSVLAAASDLAAAGLTTVDVAVDGLTSALNAYQLPADAAVEVSQKFFVAQKVGKTTVAELAQGFGLVGASAAELNVSLNELLATQSAVTRTGLSANQVYTGMKAILTNILNPTEEARKEAARLGIEFSSTAFRAKGLKGFFDEITGSAGFTKESLELMFRSSEALNTIFAITGSQAEIFNQTLNDLGDQTLLNARYDAALVATKETVSRAIQKVQSAAEIAAITLGEQFAPVIIQVADAATALVKWFRNLDSGTVEIIATVLKLGLAFTGTVFGLASLGLGAVKFISIAKEVQAAFTLIGTAARVSALGIASFTAIATGGLSLILVFLPDILSFLGKIMPQWKEFFNIGQTPEAKKTNEALTDYYKSVERIKQLNEELADLRKKSEQMRDKAQQSGSIQPEWYSVQDDIAKKSAELEALKQSYENANRSQGKTAQGQDKSAAPSDLGTKAGARQAELNARIQQADQENAILLAKQEGATQAEVELIKQRYDLLRKEKEASLILDNELRNKELENVQLQKDALFQKELEAAQKKEQFNAEMAALTEQQRLELNQKDLDALQASLQTKEDLDSAFQRKMIENHRAALQQKYNDTKRYGELYAQINSVMQSEELRGFQKTASDLSQLQNSKNEELKKVGKAAAIANITISTAQGAIAAYASLAMIPFVGPALGLAAAGALVAYGGEQVQNVTAAKKGWLVDGVGSGDKYNSILERGELVTPAKATEQFLPVMAREQNRLESSDEGLEGGGGGLARVDIRLRDRAEEFITVEQQQRTALGVAS